jgi:hypothetical protein
MTNEALPNSVPRYAIYRNRKVRVLAYYEANEYFEILDIHDQKRMVTRGQLRFLKSKEK